MSFRTVSPIDGRTGDDIDAKFIAGPRLQEGSDIVDFFRRQGFATADLDYDCTKADLADAKVGVFKNFLEFVTTDIERR